MHRHEIARLLPHIFQRTLSGGFWTQGTPASDDLLGALLLVMEQAHAPSEQILRTFDTYFDPDTAVDAFLPMLAYWVDKQVLLENDDSFLPGSDRLRDLILASMRLSKLRGTRQGLLQFLSIATGIEASRFRILDREERPFHVIIEYPEEAAPYVPLIRRIIDLEKPAYVTAELCREGEPPPDDPPPLT